ncbi:putative ferric-chelate reductase 1 [Haliotis rufescens]|uniref:putative ferric-chelate reductase 1 n=1 Tax=Haliotis rufescens TaxID=6454 RepID=UPI001EB09D17|nr:putative ferric-chelate reductase 1 [Haliotis rufescens]
MHLCIVTVLLSCLFARTLGYSFGAVEMACPSMFPLGHHGTAPQTVSSPFIIKVSDTSYYEKKKITVTLESRCNHMFKGFLIQARRADPRYDQTEFIGTFTPVMMTQGVCGPSGNSALTHSNNQTKTSLDFVWQAPAGLNDHIVFRATFVESYSTIWVNVTSSIVTGNLQIHVPFQTTWLTRNMYPCSIKDARFTMDPRCGDTMGCFHDCEALGGCSMLVSWQDRGWNVPTIDFTITTVHLGLGDKWVAIGFSEDTQMGWDSVTECVEVGTGIFFYPSYNIGHSNIRISQYPVGLTPVSGSDKDGIFQCSFRRKKVLSGDDRFYDLNKDFYLLVASGRATPEGNKIQHTWRPWISSVTIDLQKHTSIHVNTLPEQPPRPLSHPKTHPHQHSLHSHPTSV